MNCLPHNYTNVPPNDLSVVRGNLGLIQSLMRYDNVELDEMVSRVTKEVYCVLDELIAETEFVLQYTSSDESTSEKHAKYKVSVEKDVKYLMKMKAMDDEIQLRRARGDLEARELEMSDVVPISGLIMARLHVLECELRTAVEIWDHKRDAQLLKDSRTSSLARTQAFDSFTGHSEYDECGDDMMDGDDGEFELELGVDGVEWDTGDDEVMMAMALATRPPLTPECCVSVVLRRKNKIQLGKARVLMSGEGGDGERHTSN